MSMMGGLGNMNSLIRPVADAAGKAVKANNVKSVKLKLKVKKGDPDKK